ncbi:platelet-activating factor acetylhydrolase, isoform II-domain-containing protein [Chytridium lagenaria]|nr:platelet-activating factor acetylhydrolase, isoform II-domain-containing protein [Chytridium lagenaria]
MAPGSIVQPQVAAIQQDTASIKSAHRRSFFGSFSKFQAGQKPAQTPGHTKSSSISSNFSVNSTSSTSSSTSSSPSLTSASIASSPAPSSPSSSGPTPSFGHSSSFDPPTKFPANPGPHPVGVLRLELPSTDSTPGLLCTLFYPCDGPSTPNTPPMKFSDLLTELVGSVHVQALWGTAGYRVGLGKGKTACHGLFGTQFMYSTLMTNLASRGFVTVVIEHRDGSACTSGRNNFTERIDYLDPLSEAHYPGRKGSAHSYDHHNAFRSHQITYRKREIREAITLIQRLNAGSTLSDLHNLLRQRSTRPVEFKERLDLDNICMMGHSFGGATTVATMQDEELGKVFKCAVVLDPFMCTVLDARTPILKPMLSVQSQIFHWRVNLVRCVALHQHVKAHPLNIFAYIPDTIHQDLSDLPSISPMLMRKVGIAGKCEPKRVFQGYDELFCGFLGTVLENRVAEGWRGIKRGVAVEGEQAMRDLFTGIPETWEELYPSMVE